MPDPGVEEPDRVGGAVGGQRDEPDQRHGKQRHARRTRSHDGRPRIRPRQISITTGSTSGRSPERFRKNRCRSTRIFSLMSPGSVRSSTLARLERRGEQRRDLLEQRLSARVQHEAARDHVRRLFEASRTACRCSRPARPGRRPKGGAGRGAPRRRPRRSACRRSDTRPAGTLSGNPPALVVEADDVAVLRQQDSRRPGRRESRPGRAGRAAGTPRVSARSSCGLTSDSMSLSSSSLP